MLAGDVFSKDQIEAYIELKNEEIQEFEHTPHPLNINYTILANVCFNYFDLNRFSEVICISWRLSFLTT